MTLADILVTEAEEYLKERVLNMICGPAMESDESE